MPTYVCSVAAGALTGSQKSKIARAIARVHTEATGAPAYLVQVIFDEKAASERFLGGEPAANHVWIRGDIRAGRTLSQRESLALNIVKGVSDITGIDAQSIWVYLCNLEPTDMVEYGHVLPRPGGEQEWFENLPKSLQNHLANLGAKKDESSR